MSAGKGGNITFIRRRKFWPQYFWLAVMVGGCLLSWIFRSPELFVAAILVAFLGMNEFGYWSYKTNLVICAAAAVTGSLAGVFTWFEIAAVFVLVCTAGGFILYYRDESRRLIPGMRAFAACISKEKTLPEMVWRAHDLLTGMLPECKVFIAVADDLGGLYIPGRGDAKGRVDLRRKGGSVWKVFASGRPFITDHVDPAKDLPLYREAHSMISCAIIFGGENIGVLQVETRASNAFSDDDLDRLSFAALILAQPLHGFLSSDKAEKKPESEADKK